MARTTKKVSRRRKIQFQQESLPPVGKFSLRTPLRRKKHLHFSGEGEKVGPVRNRRRECALIIDGSSGEAFTARIVRLDSGSYDGTAFPLDLMNGNGSKRNFFVCYFNTQFVGLCCRCGDRVDHGQHDCVEVDVTGRPVVSCHDGAGWIVNDGRWRIARGGEWRMRRCRRTDWRRRSGRA